MCGLLGAGGGGGGGKGYVGPPPTLLWEGGGRPLAPVFLRLCCHVFIGRNDVYLPYDVAIRAE